MSVDPIPDSQIDALTAELLSAEFRRYIEDVTAIAQASKVVADGPRAARIIEARTRAYQGLTQALRAEAHVGQEVVHAPLGFQGAVLERIDAMVGIFREQAEARGRRRQRPPAEIDAEFDTEFASVSRAIAAGWAPDPTHPAPPRPAPPRPAPPSDDDIPF